MTVMFWVLFFYEKVRITIKKASDRCFFAMWLLLGIRSLYKPIGQYILERVMEIFISNLLKCQKSFLPVTALPYAYALSYRATIGTVFNITCGIEMSQVLKLVVMNSVAEIRRGCFLKCFLLIL